MAITTRSRSRNRSSCMTLALCTTVAMFLSVVATATTTADTHVQSILIYENSTLFGAVNESYSHNIGNLQQVTKLSSTLGACLQSIGVWMYYTKPNYEPVDNYNILRFNTGDGGRACVTANANITSIRHVGHSDLTQSALSLYTTGEMVAGKELYFDGVQLILPETIAFGSYGFTGGKNWVVDGQEEEVAVNGTGICLDVVRAEDGGDNQTKPVEFAVATKEQFTSQLLVKSIRRSCTGTEKSVLVPDTSIAGENTTMQRDEDTSTPTLTLTVLRPSDGVLREDTRNPEDELKLTFTGNELRLPKLYKLTNYTIAGSAAAARNFTVYDNLELSGNFTCLQVGKSIGDYNQSGGTMEGIVVGGIKIGCVGDPGRSGAGAKGRSSISMGLMALSFVVFLAVIFK